MMTRVRDQRGFTVAEMLVSAAVIALIMGGLLSLLMSGQQSYLAGANRAEAQQNSRLVLERMVRELRTAGHDPRRTEAFSAVTALASGTGFVIRNDWNASGAIETNVTVTVDNVAHGEQITYTFTGTTLTRQESSVDGSAVAVTNRVSGLTIQYLDADDNTVSSPSGANATLIRTVVLDATTLPDTSEAGTATNAAVRSQTRVRVRNR
jgi:prepilin-type N-terminal cleavage/methylation domain-containing protein